MTLKQALAIKAYFEAAPNRLREEAGEAYGVAMDIIRNHAYNAVKKWKREQTAQSEKAQKTLERHFP